MKNAPFHRRLLYALNGISVALKTEKSFRFQMGAALGACGVLAFFQASPLWWALFALSIGGVLSLELVNTALEHLIDLLHPEKHPSIKIVKDCAAAGVLIFSLATIVVFCSFCVQNF